MKKYYVYFDDLCDEKPVPQPGFTDHEVYLASDVDALLQANAATAHEQVSALNARVRALEDTLRQARLEWAMVCSCECKACDEFYETLKRLSP
jgi:hypothetical protein